MNFKSGNCMSKYPQVYRKSPVVTLYDPTGLRVTDRRLRGYGPRFGDILSRFYSESTKTMQFLLAT